MSLVALAVGHISTKFEERMATSSSIEFCVCGL